MDAPIKFSRQIVVHLFKSISKLEFVIIIVLLSFLERRSEKLKRIRL